MSTTVYCDLCRQPAIYPIGMYSITVEDRSYWRKVHTTSLFQKDTPLDICGVCLGIVSKAGTDIWQKRSLQEIGRSE